MYFTFMVYQENIWELICEYSYILQIYTPNLFGNLLLFFTKFMKYSIVSKLRKVTEIMQIKNNWKLILQLH